MRPTSFIGLMGLVILGVIVADFLIHPTGTKAAANGLNKIVTPSYSALLGGRTVQQG